MTTLTMKDYTFLEQLISPETRSDILLHHNCPIHYDDLIQLSKPEQHFTIRYWAMIHLTYIDLKDIPLFIDYLYQNDSRIRELSIDLIYKLAQISNTFLGDPAISQQIIDTLLDRNPKVCRVTIDLLTLFPDLSIPHKFIHSILTTKKLNDQQLYWLLKGLNVVYTEENKETIDSILHLITILKDHKKYTIREQLAYLVTKIPHHTYHSEEQKETWETLLNIFCHDSNFYVKNISMRYLKTTESKYEQ